VIQVLCLWLLSKFSERVLCGIPCNGAMLGNSVHCVCALMFRHALMRARRSHCHNSGMFHTDLFAFAMSDNGRVDRLSGLPLRHAHSTKRIHEMHVVCR
jgi:hypothetical protein